MNPEPSKFEGIRSYLKSDKFCFHLLVSQLALYLCLNLNVIVNGNTGILSQAMDSDNNLCGNDIAVVDYPFVYFVFPDSSLTYRTTCVKVCPLLEDVKLSCYPNSKVSGCNTVNSVFDPAASIVIYETFPYMKSICAPQIYLYYKKVQDGIIPSSFNQLAHDAYVTRWWVFLFGVLVSSLLMLFMNKILDEYIQQSIWLFILSTITFLGFSGLYYSKLTKIASDLLQKLVALDSMRLTPEYIFLNSNAPDFYINGCIAIISISLFIFLSVLLFQQIHSTEFKQFFKVLKVVDLCLDAYKVSKTRSRSFAFQMCIILCMCLGFYYFLSMQIIKFEFIRHLFTCVSRIDEPILNPYNKTKLQPSTLILLMVLTASFAFQLNFIYNCYNFVTSSTISRQIEYTMMSDDKNKNDDFDQHFTKSAIDDLKYNIPQLAKMSVFKIIYLIPTLIVDLIFLFKKKNILENDNWLGRFYRENIRYNLSIINIELQQHNCSFKEAMDHVKDVFIKNEQSSDNFDKYSSQIIMTQLFSLSAKMLSFAAVFSIFNLASNMPYFTAILYSSMLPSLIGGFICYMICSLYISYYQMSGETIYYLSLKDYQGTHLERQLRNKLQDGKDQ